MGEGLLIVIMASALYAIAISYGMPREMDNRIITRPIVVAGGIAIVIVVKEWGNWDAMVTWFVWLAVSAIPQVIRVAVIHINDDKRRKLQGLGIGQGSDDHAATS